MVVVGPFAPGVTEARRAVVGQAVAGVPDAVESIEAVAGDVTGSGHPVQREPFLGVSGEAAALSSGASPPPKLMKPPPGMRSA